MQEDLPHKKVENQYDDLRVVVLINRNIIHINLINDGLGLNVCS